MEQSETDNIRKQNDRFRIGDVSIPGQRVMTQGIAEVLQDDPEKQLALLKIVADFDDFTEENDPYQTHDFGIFDFEGCRCNWKIDLYDKGYEFGSEDPSDLSKTNRVLTILLAREY